MKIFFTNIFIFFLTVSVYSQLDTVKYQWPVTPLQQSQGISGTFCEFRNTGSSDHFHNAVDIPEPDGSPVYACIDGIVHYVATNEGSNSYVRVRTNVDGKWKHLTYLHIVPNPSLSVGEEVTAGVTILGSIYSGMGHTHLIERELVTSASSNGAAINNLRESGGLTPYNDTFEPTIHDATLGFVLDGTDFELPPNGLSGKIDIKIKIEEVNGTSSIYRNNGTYIAGYRIWNLDRDSVVFEQFPNGVTYRFDREPVDADVHNVYVLGEATLSDPVYWLTNGNGADYINQNLRVTDQYLDTELIEEGDYYLEVFTEDTRQNFVNKFYPVSITRNDVAPPNRPELAAILNTDGKKSVLVIWEQNDEPDIAGYRLYYSINGQLSTWAVAGNETILTKDISSYTFDSPEDFIEPTTNDIYFFYLTAVDSAGNESERSDIYSRSSYFEGSIYPKALIVDGFDRYGGSGSWQSPVHSFNTSYFIPLTLADSVVISSASNDAILSEDVLLGGYDIVIWFLGDESTADNTFISEEQGKLAAFLENGGKLVVSGSEVGWDLDRSHSNSQVSDTLFYRHYLKARYVYDGTSSMNIVNGVTETFFSNVVMNIGQVYDEDYPDDIDPINGSEIILNYNQSRSGTSEMRHAGVAYTGTFGDGTETGQVIYCAFPVETVFSLQQRTDFTRNVLEYFGVMTDVEGDEPASFPNSFYLSQNYPNPFNPTTKIKYSISPFLGGAGGGLKQQTQHAVCLRIYDILGREIKTLVDELQSPGVYEVRFNGLNLASGVYFARLAVTNARNGNLIYTSTKNMVLAK